MKTVFLAILYVSGQASACQAAGESIRGRVQERSADRVRVCFDDGFKVREGDAFDVVRHSIVAMPKGTPQLRSARVGRVKVATVIDATCTDTTLVQGEAQAQDWIALQSDRE